MPTGGKEWLVQNVAVRLANGQPFARSVAPHFQSGVVHQRRCSSGVRERHPTGLEIQQVHLQAGACRRFKSMLRRKGITAVSITEHTDDSPTGKLLTEAIIESMDELYSENLAQDVVRGMGEVYSIAGSAVGRTSARVPTPVSTANYGCPSFAD